MTQVHGQIESLKRIKAHLYQEGIRRFNSLGEMSAFQSNYEREKQDVILEVGADLCDEIDVLRAKAEKLCRDFIHLKKQHKHKHNIEISELTRRIETLKGTKRQYLILHWFYFVVVYFLNLKKSKVEKDFKRAFFLATAEAQSNFENAEREYQYFVANKQSILQDRCEPRLRELTRVKNVIESLSPLVAGAIGENLVVKELSTLPNDCILINDFSVDFVKPIYNRREKDRIYSIQIDHLLVTNAGIFVIETKNWSRKSIDSLSLRSPVKQVRRTSYALFVILNGASSSFQLHHHWGERQIPIKSLVAMINNKPKEKFKYVQVKTLKELNSYISHFEPIFSDAEVRSIANYLNLVRN